MKDRSPKEGLRAAETRVRSGHLVRCVLVPVLALLVLGSALLIPVAAHAASPHAGAGGDTCGACHSLHEASTEGSLLKGAASEAGEVPTCLFCHDGTGASSSVQAGPDSFAGLSGHRLEDATAVAERLDLTNACSDCHSPHGDHAVRPKLPARTVNGAALSGTGSGWCFACHNDAQDWYDAIGVYPAPSEPSRDATGYPVVGTYPGHTVYANPAVNAHASIPATTTPEVRGQGDCLFCHNAHGSANGYDGLNAAFRPSTAATVLGDRIAGTYAAACFQCHDGTRVADGARNIKQFVTHEAGDEGLMASGGHRIKSAGGTLPVNAPLPCYDCHNPHGSSRGNASLISDELGGGLHTADPGSVRRFCLSCHVTSDVTGWDSDASAYVSLATSTARVEGLLRNGGTFGDSNHPDGGFNWLRLKVTPGHYEADTISCYECHGNDYSAPEKHNVHRPGSYSVAQHTVAPPNATITILGANYTNQVCASCHDLEMGPEHAKASASSSAAACAACHPAPRDTLTSEWENDSCAEGGCHTAASTAPMHSALDAGHTPPPSSCVTAGCHNENGLAAIHDDGNSATNDCALCHASGVPATKVCTVCHVGDPHPDADHTVSGPCISSGCHDIDAAPNDDMADASAIHDSIAPAGPGCAACHAPGVTLSFACRECHTTPHTEVNHGSANTCVSCHSTGNLMPLHGDDCGRCHATSSPALTYTGSCTASGCHPTPHSGIAEPYYHVDHGDGPDCASCHYVGNCYPCHWQAPIPNAYKDLTAPVTASNVVPAYVNAAFINFTTSDTGNYVSGVATTYFQVNNGVLQQGTRAVVVGPDTGTRTYTIEYWSVDRFGNTETHRIARFTITAGPPDTNPPTGTMSVNNGAAFAITRAATVNSAVTDAESGIVAMRIDPGTGTYGSWIPYLTSQPITLAAGDGVKTVRAQYIDVGDNVLTLTDTITLDVTPPTGTMAINNGAAATNTTSVTINSYVTGATEMRFGIGWWGAWEPYSPTKAWTLATGSGWRTVWAQYRDVAGNVIEVSDSIILDPVAPGGTMSVNNGATFASSTSVTVNSAVTDSGGSGMASLGMRIDPGTGTFGSWITYAASRAITIPSGDGVKTVRAEYRDNAGNIRQLTDTITLDTTPPTGTMVLNGDAASTNVLTVSVDSAMVDALSGISQMRVDPGTGTYGAWFAYSPTHTITLPAGDGLKTVNAQYRDGVGITATVTDTITVALTGTDFEPPTGSVVVAGGASSVPSTSVTLTLSAADTGGSGLADMRFSNNSSAWSAWEPYATSKAWSVTSGDGDKIVYAQYRDGNGNISAVTADGVTLFTTPTTTVRSVSIWDWTWFDSNLGSSGPWGTYSIYVNDVLIGVKPANAVSTWAFPGVNTPGGGHIDIVVDCGFTNYSYIWDWHRPNTFTINLPASTSRIEASTWTGFLDVSTGYGLWYGGYGSYYDAAYIMDSTIGNIVCVLGGDTAAPTGSITINGGDYTQFDSVALTLAAADTGGSGLSQMRFSNDNLTWSTWQAYATSRSWTLSSGEGAKTVYAQFRDITGNISPTYSDGVFFDNVPPAGSLLINAGDSVVATQAVTLSPSAGDGVGSGVSHMRFSNDNLSWSAWEPYAATKAWNLSYGDGTKTVYVQYRDNAGIESLVYLDTITLWTPGAKATLHFRWGGWGYAQLRLENSSGVTLTSTALSGWGDALSWYVQVEPGQDYFMVCDYYDDWENETQGGGYGKWSNDVSINPDGFLSPGETVIWDY